MKTGDRRALVSALGAEGVREHEPEEVDALPIGVTLAPASAEALAGALRVLHERDLAVLVRGGGTRLRFGNPPRRAACFLSTERLAEVEELDAEEGVARVGAGAALRELRARANGAGWDPPLDAPGATTSVGGLLACAALGPRVAGFGRPRDAVLGMDVVLASGARTRCGGRVVKNVTGYDLAKLYTGSLGTLGVIASAWLRLRPLPERVAVVAATLPSEPGALERALAAAQLPGARAVAVVDGALAPDLAGDPAPGSNGRVFVAELAGDAPVVEAALARVAADLGARPAPASALERVREIQGASPGERGLRVRVDALPARVHAGAERLRDAGARLLVYPGAGLAFAFFDLAADAGDARAALAAARDAARAGGGGFVLEEAPLAVKRAHDVFGDPPGGLGIMRALKQRFDPQGILNPGRFAGGV
jgi:glycolate oxidase FAD binding subunit